MKPASLAQIRKELKYLSEDQLRELCLRLARFKIDNKELLTYCLFESENEESYVAAISDYIDTSFEEINTKNYYYIKKSIRKILRQLRKFIRYSGKKETEFLIHLKFAQALLELNPSIFNNNSLTKLYLREIQILKSTLKKLHEDLQFEYNIELSNLLNKSNKF
ncbi:hypothetical protein [Aegicerativicinus sediminis]|uniref:hypothetical protein n=1 Tax=Aegicerativicinus sediminis TaxID=2893202 RepID=UPI001E601D23|nr:hypothetical protein [Aegicerativicinus sediminis]